MRQAPLLEFDAPAVGHYRAQHAILQECEEELAPLAVEGMGDEIKPIVRLLAWAEVAHDVGPLRVGSHGDAQVRLPTRADDGHGV